MAIAFWIFISMFFFGGIGCFVFNRLKRGGEGGLAIVVPILISVAATIIGGVGFVVITIIKAWVG